MTEGIVRKCLSEAIAAAEAGDRDFFITLESRANEDAWLQLGWDSINAAYPHEDAPVKVLEALVIAVPDGIAVEAWEPRKFVTFEHPAYPSEPIAQFADEYFANVLRVNPSPFTLKITRD